MCFANVFNMKKSLIFLFSFLSLFSLSQEYHFDYYIKYDYTVKKNKATSTIDFQSIINSKNHLYQMSFTSNNGKTFIATITDFKNNLQHYFNVINTKFPLNNEDFIYKYSRRMQDSKKQFEDESKRRFFNAEFIDTQDGSLSCYSIKEFTDEKMNNLRTSSNVIFADFKVDLSFVGLQLFFDYHEIYNKVKFQNNYVLKSASKKYEDKEVNLVLEAVESQNFSIKINQNQIKFKSN